MDEKHRLGMQRVTKCGNRFSCIFLQIQDLIYKQFHIANNLTEYCPFLFVHGEAAFDPVYLFQQAFFSADNSHDNYYF